MRGGGEFRLDDHHLSVGRLEDRHTETDDPINRINATISIN